MAITFVGSSVAEASATNGGTATITLGSALEIDDVAIVAVTLGTSRTISAASSLTVTTSDGTAYTQIVPTVTSSFAKFSVWRLVLSSSQIGQAVCPGTGASSDSNAAVALTFRGVRSSAPEDVSPTSTSGTLSQPDSPSITVASSDDAVITAVGQQVNDTTVTAPSSFLNQIDINANDTWDATTGMAWITLASTSAFNPAAWSNFSIGTGWASATVALKAAEQLVFTWQDYGLGFELPDFRSYEIVGY